MGSWVVDKLWMGGSLGREVVWVNVSNELFLFFSMKSSSDYRLCFAC